MISIHFLMNVVEPVLVETTELSDVEEYGHIVTPINLAEARTRQKLTYLLQRSIDLKDQIMTQLGAYHCKSMLLYS